MSTVLGLGSVFKWNHRLGPELGQGLLPVVCSRVEPLAGLCNLLRCSMAACGVPGRKCSRLAQRPGGATGRALQLVPVPAESQVVFPDQEATGGVGVQTGPQAVLCRESGGGGGLYPARRLFKVNNK